DLGVKVEVVTTSDFRLFTSVAASGGFLIPASARASSADSSFQSARKSWDFPSAVRLEVQASFAPSGEKTGRPSKPSVKVTRTGSRVPLASTRKSSKLAQPSLLAVKMT